MAANNQPAATVPQRPPLKPGPIGVLLDLISRGVRGELHLPPWWLRDVGGSDFVRTGQEFLRLFIGLGQLRRDAQVLEIGCGSGRMAFPLTTYLSQRGSYKGMDITRESIVWCQRHITRRHPNFKFLHIDLYNKRYNPNGEYLAKDYEFPFHDAAFDFIFLTSVFTHLLPEDTENYLREVGRMLRQEGRSFMTFFLLNETQHRLAKQGRNRIDFKYGRHPYRLRSADVPESAVAYDEAFVRQLLRRSGLSLVESIHYGTWSGREHGLSFQDILLVKSGGE